MTMKMLASVLLVCVIGIGLSAQATAPPTQPPAVTVPKAPEVSNEVKQQIIIAFQGARIAALEAEKADQAAKALFADVQAKVCGDGYVLSQALACEAKPKVL